MGFESLLIDRPPLWRQALVGSAAVVIALGVRFSVEPFLGSNLPFLTLYPAVMAAAIFAGPGAGVTACVLSVSYALWLVMARPFPLVVDGGVATAGGLLFILGSCLLIAVAHLVRRAMRQARDAHARLEAALNASQVGTWRWDVIEDRVEWDASLRAVYGLDESRAPQSSAQFLALIHQQDRERVRGALHDALRRRGVAEFEFRYAAADGPERWIYDRSRVVRDKSGAAIAMIGACLDITDRKSAEDKQALLVRELHHRVRNTLGTVQALISSTSRTARSAAELRDSLSDRVRSLARTHDLLTNGLEQRANLRDILWLELEAFADPPERVRLEGPPATLESSLAFNFAMAVHELATNAAKHGALSSPSGRIEATWRLAEDGDVVELDWRETGGPQVAAPERRGFGTTLLTRLFTERDALTLDFAPEGLHCLLRLRVRVREARPVEQVVALT